MKKICDFIARWMGALVLLAAIVAVVKPEPFMAVDTWWINPMLGLIMFGMGLTLSPQDFRVVFSRPKDVLVGCLAQFTIMPLIAWLLTRLFALPEELALGVLLPWRHCVKRDNISCQGRPRAVCGYDGNEYGAGTIPHTAAHVAYGGHLRRGQYRRHAAQHTLCGHCTDSGGLPRSALSAEAHKGRAAIPACILDGYDNTDGDGGGRA